MTIVSVFGVLFGLLAILVFVRGSFHRYVLAAALAVAHLVVANIYFMYTQSNLADSYSYYHYDYYFRAFPWTTLGTMFAGHLVQVLKHTFDATYYDCFMVFQAFGFWGIIILLRTFEEIANKTQTKESFLTFCLLFIPSMQFWTTAIGKDAPVFFAVSLCTWSIVNFPRKLGVLAFSVVVMVLFRPYVALAVAIALAAAVFIDRNIKAARKSILIAISLVALIFLIASVRSTFNVDITDADSLSAFMQGRVTAESSDIVGTKLGSSFFLRLISLLFRPFFFDANTAYSMVASVENVGSIVLIGYLLLHFRDVRALSKNVLFIRFSIFFTVILIAVLAVVNYNVGLGLRERVMVYPPLFSLFVATSAYRRRIADLARGPLTRAAASPRTSDRGVPRLRAG